MALALYRKYRPAKLAEVVGQEHVTEPLSTALTAGRINHAYLFSGPRGCGKTSSARILARSLNCVQGPTPEPCGVCDSCIALAPEGSGSIDVVELDAASHGGVEDARELRDRAFYAPAESRYRVFIVDEAHMVTTQGFNALLKIVEEPPDHLVFIFATTEPEKVLPTIRSRTHHYPFRLIPPGTMRSLLERICGEEGVTVAPPVFPLVIRAGGGSARDTLSVLDQLLAGAGPDGVTYERAVALLGVTDAALIDDTVDALAAGDGAAVYQAVDRLVEAGHDPRRFASDLLQRLRDLMLVQAVPEAAERGLVDGAEDELSRMADQASRLGAATLARYGEIVHSGLIEMRGATAPRLLLELLCARMLLPAATTTDAGLLERLERIERRNAIAPEPGASGGDAEPVKRAFVRPTERGAAQPAATGSESGQAPREQAGREQAAPPREQPAPAREQTPREQAPREQAAPARPPAAAAERPAAAADSGATGSGSGPSVAAGDASGGGARRAEAEDSEQEAATAEPSRPSADDLPPQVAAAAASPGAAAPSTTTPQRPPTERPQPRAQQPESHPTERSTTERPTTERPTTERPTTERPATERPASQGGAPIEPVPENGPAEPAEPAPVASSLDAAAVRRVWPEILAAARQRSRSTEALLVNATVRAVDGDMLVLTIGSAPLARRLSEPRNTDVIVDSLRAVLGVQWRVRCDQGDAGGAAPARPARAERPAPQRPAPQRPSRSEGEGGDTPQAPPPAPGDRAPDRVVPQRRSQAAGRRPSSDGGEPLPPEPPPEDAPPDRDDEESMMAEAAADAGSGATRRDPEVAAMELLSNELGAKAFEQR
ncbi:DNA polymerase-3 subunit gamma/tau [Pseudonocardia sediminis]|uniref:DNA polymerase III subunit gamma/tau n=1 Tax=Pseudonocardia sediminis TaxID=1397368 RepID=A0A4Q7UP92_PSEST|nr:DNA polymerase III subunit gamma and tau [Pseudonocardia sediminis]RZT83557.1 DNA polymerase-3 subunit gamma/tau [Pseudonocardia sediminis]